MRKLLAILLAVSLVFTLTVTAASAHYGISVDKATSSNSAMIAQSNYLKQTVFFSGDSAAFSDAAAGFGFKNTAISGASSNTGAQAVQINTASLIQVAKSKA